MSQSCLIYTYQLFYPCGRWLDLECRVGQSTFFHLGGHVRDVVGTYVCACENIYVLR